MLDACCLFSMMDGKSGNEERKCDTPSRTREVFFVCLFGRQEGKKTCGGVVVLCVWVCVWEKGKSDAAATYKSTQKIYQKDDDVTSYKYKIILLLYIFGFLFFFSRQHKRPHLEVVSWEPIKRRHWKLPKKNRASSHTRFFLFDLEVRVNWI